MKESNEKRENRPWKILELILFLVSLVLFVVVLVSKPTGVDSGSLDTFLYWIYVLVLFAICVTLLFPLFAAFKNKKKLLRLVLLIVAAVVIIGGAWLLAPGKPIDTNAVTKASDFKMADTVLFVTYLMVAAAVCSLIWSAIRKAVKK